MTVIWKKIRQFIYKIYGATYYYLFILFYPDKAEIAKRSPLNIKGYIIPQKILNINKSRDIKWPVHFTSMVSGNITVGKFTAPGYMPGCYIQGKNGIKVGNNVYIGPSVKIISSNHDEEDYRLSTSGNPIIIGNDVWIGANAIILPNTVIGDNVIIGAGTVLTKNIESNSIVVGNPGKIIREKKKYTGKY